MAMSDRPVVTDQELFSSFPAAHPYSPKDDEYQAHLLEQYKVYVGMADKISDRSPMLHNEHSKPFVRTKTADGILARVARLCKRLSDSGHCLFS